MPFFNTWPYLPLQKLLVISHLTADTVVNGSVEKLFQQLWRRQSLILPTMRILAVKTSLEIYFDWTLGIGLLI